MNIFIRLFLIVSAAAASGCARNAQVSDPHQIAAPSQVGELREKIEAAARDEITNSGVPSLQIAVAHGRTLIFNDAFGLADVENNVPATNDTKYRSASIDKWLTATAAFRLVEKGQMDLDIPIQEYCPEFPQKKWPITARNLLTHTSGIRHNLDFPKLIAEASTDHERTRLENMQIVEQLGEYTRYTDVVTPLDNFANDDLLFEPGTDYSYTSFGYRVLGCVMQGAAGRPFRNIMESEVFTPSSMTDIVDDDAWAIVPGRASGYFLKNDGSVLRAAFRDVSENLPAGGHLATAADLISFVHAFNSGDLVSAETRSLMITAPVFAGSEPFEPGYAYGIELVNSDIGKWIGHTGSQSGATALVVYFPADDISVAIMTNVYGWRGVNEFTSKIKGIVAAEIMMAE